MASLAAYVAAILFALHLLSYFVPTLRDATMQTLAGAAIALVVLAVLQHLVVFPVAASWSAPRWSQAAAYIWLVVDMLTDLAQLGGVPKATYLPVRLAVNVLAALWIASSSWRESRAVQVIGIVIAIDLVAYSALGLLTPAAALIILPSLVLLPVWFLLVGRRLARPVDTSTSLVSASGHIAQ